MLTAPYRTLHRLFSACLVLGSFTLHAPAAIAGEWQPFKGTLAHNVPARPANAPSGSEFLKMTSRMSAAEREGAILYEIRRGNVPDSMRVLKPVRFTTMKAGVPQNVVLYVMADYLAVGSNEDAVLMPMNFYTATKLANAMGYVLPTAKMVDAIYTQADLRIGSPNYRPNPSMHSNAIYADHNRVVRGLVSSAQGEPGDIPLIAGHKKDIILTKRLFNRPDHIAIYGWHGVKGVPVQPVSTIHAADYADYSHGVRFVSELAYVNGRPVPLFDLMADPAFARVLNGEGAVANMASLMKPVAAPRRHVIAQN